MHYIATATRRNVDGKPDYRWVFRHDLIGGTPVRFNNEAEALDCAMTKCADSAHALYAPKAEMQFTQHEIDQWREYEAVRESGEYNMFDPAARDETSMSRAEWLFCIAHYDQLKQAAKE